VNWGFAGNGKINKKLKIMIDILKYSKADIM
jgi:hypothetical protein